MKRYWCGECHKQFETDVVDYYYASYFQDVLCPYCDTQLIYEKNQGNNVLRPIEVFQNQRIVLMKCNADLFNDDDDL